MKRIFIALSALLLGPTAYALPGYWDTSYAQGYLEYGLTNKDGNTVIIACNDGGADWLDHGVSLYLKGYDERLQSDDGDEAPIEFVISDEVFRFPTETKTRSGENSWLGLTGAISKASSFDVFWNGEFFGNFESRNTEKTIKSISTCKPMATRDMGYEDNNSAASSNQIDEGRASHTPMPDNPFKITTQYADPFGHGFGAYYRVHVTSLDDSIILNKAIVNRGNCNIQRYDSVMPVRLGYGHSTYFIVPGTCDILEIGLSTNKGEVTYNL